MTDDLPPIPGADEDRNGYRSDGMTVLQRRFADCYIRLLGEGEGRGIKQKAAKEAGYAPSDAPNAASKNLRLPPVVKYIAAHLNASTAEVGITPTFVLFKSMVALETAEATGNVMGMMRALELLHKHVDVRAAFGLANTIVPDADGGPATYDLASLSDEELVTYVALRRKLAKSPRADDAGNPARAGTPPESTREG